jgi:hypothetical protein
MYKEEMEILFFYPRWGSANIPWKEFAERVKSAGFDGVETDIPINPYECENMLQALEEKKLLLIAQHWETTDPHFETHLDEYTGRIAFLASAEPLFINSQTGKDYFSFHESQLLIQTAHKIAVTTGIPVYHETHRGKFSFAAHITKKFLEHDPSIGLTFDVSHWCAVAESLLNDQQDAVALAIDRTRHIHARVGHAQGPQVIDPRNASVQDALQFHLQCWDRIVKENERKGEPMLTFTMEFGPAPYMMHDPITGKPLTDQWELNVYMKNLLSERYIKSRTLLA